MNVGFGKETEWVPLSDKEYQAACTGLKNIMRQWQSEWKVACDVSKRKTILSTPACVYDTNFMSEQKFQEMEEKRIEFLHHSLCVYVNILQTVTDQEREVCIM
jgi:hypothetical protein